MAAHGVARVTHQQMQELELFGTELDLAITARDSANGRIEFQVLYPEDAQGRISLAPQERVGPRREFPERKWLGYVVVCSQVERLDAV